MNSRRHGPAGVSGLFRFQSEHIRTIAECNGNEIHKNWLVRPMVIQIASQTAF